MYVAIAHPILHVQSTKGVKCLDHVPTAAYCVVLDGQGEMCCGIGDMDAMDHVTPQWVEQHADMLQSSSIVLMDGNIPLETMKAVCQLCKEKSIQGIHMIVCDSSCVGLLIVQ